MGPRLHWTVGCLAAGLLLGGEALAQRSLFDPPASAPAPAAPATPAQAASPAAAEPAAKPKPKAKPKPRGPVPARALTIDNSGSSTLAALQVGADGKTAKLAKPLPGKKKIVLKLPALKGCTATVTATFEGQPPETSEVDICKDKTIRFTE